MGKKRRRTDEDTEFDLTRKAKEVKDDNEKRLIVILENAQLETVKVNTNDGLLFKISSPSTIICVIFFRSEKLSSY